MTVSRKSEDSQRRSTLEGANRTRYGRWVAAAVVAVVLTGSAISLLMPGKPRGPQPPDRIAHSREPGPPEETHGGQSSEFVGSQACAECHADIAESYSKHPMANTLATVADAAAIEVVEGDAAEFETQGCRYRVERH